MGLPQPPHHLSHAAEGSTVQQGGHGSSTHPSPKSPKMTPGLAAHPSRCVFTTNTCGVIRANKEQQASGAASQEPTHKALQEDVHLSLKHVEKK